VPFAECLLPENFWTDEDWFHTHAVKLSGTSSVYRIVTKRAKGIQRTIVLKWNRMGQDVPAGEDDIELTTAAFNSPFEEFALVNELRGAVSASEMKLFVHKPLAIFVRPERVELWKVGRRRHMMQAIIEKHVEIELDMYRSYGVVYDWLKGLDAAEACRQGLIDDGLMEALTLGAEARLRKQGFEVKDSKPQHVIVRPRKDGSLLKDRTGEILYGVVDFELLTRTPDRERIVRDQRRKEYLRRQRDRFACRERARMPRHLKLVTVMDVDYVFGRCETTDGQLWVVGRDPGLFEYFLPERWEKEPRTRLSAYSEIFHTLTRDNVNLVWKASKVGVSPDVDPFREDERRILEHGYNSPFEEVSLAMCLNRAGVPTVYPRAIYMTGVKTEVTDALADDRRFRNHESLLTPDGSRILRRDRDYILIWGYWNGPDERLADERLADEDGNYYRGVSALRALREGLISQETYVGLLQDVRNRLRDAGVEDLNLRGSHILLSLLGSTGHLITDGRGKPEVRICSFELLKMVPGHRADEVISTDRTDDS
jgi:hypothetical protein